MPAMLMHTAHTFYVGAPISRVAGRLKPENPDFGEDRARMPSRAKENPRSVERGLLARSAERTGDQFFAKALPPAPPRIVPENPG